MDSIRLDQGQIEMMDDQMVDIIRQKTSAERIGIGFEIWVSARRMLHAHLKATHPNWSEKQINQEVARRLSHGAV